MPRKRINILLTSAGRRGALINLFRKTIREAKNLEAKIVCVDANPLSPGLYLSDEHHVVPRVTEDEYIPALLNICQETKISLLIPLIDTELLILANNKERFENIGVRICVSEPRVIKLCADKYKTYQFFKENNIPTVKFFRANEAIPSTMQYPLFIKPRRGSGSVDAFKVRNEREMLFFLNYVRDPVVQEYAQGKEYTLDVLADFKGNVVRVVPRERIEVRAGETSKGITIKSSNLIKRGKEIMERLGAIGPVTIQCFVTDEGVKFTEINPRFGGGLPLSVAAGANYPLLLVKMVLGEKISGAIDEFQEGMIMLRYEDAVFIDNRTLQLSRGNTEHD